MVVVKMENRMLMMAGGEVVVVTSVGGVGEKSCGGGTG